MEKEQKGNGVRRGAEPWSDLTQATRRFGLYAAALALLALALARPVLRGAGWLADGEGPVAAALVIDTAPRMALREANETRLERAAKLAHVLLDKLPEGSKVAVLDTAGTTAAFSPSSAAAGARIDRLAAALAFVCGVGLLLLALLITWDIVARKAFGLSVQGTDELGGYVLALIGSLGMAHVLLRREFTRIDLVLPYLPARLRQVLHVAAYVALAGTVVFFAYRAGLTLQETLLFDSVANTPLQTPLWIPQGLWATGMALFAAAAVLHAARAVVLLVREPQRIEAEYGCASTQNEVDAFLSGADQAGGRAA